MPGPVPGWRKALGHRQNSEYGRRRQAVTHNNDGSFSVIVKHYFKLLQTTHHTGILVNGRDNGVLPPGMQRQLTKLSGFIKPACPSPGTLNRVQTVTKDWMSRILEILLEHYDTQTATLLNSLPTWNEEAFNKATSWAKNRYKRKLTDASITAVRSLLQGEGRTPETGLRSTSTPVRNRLSYAEVARGSECTQTPANHSTVSDGERPHTESERTRAVLHGEGSEGVIEGTLNPQNTSITVTRMVVADVHRETPQSEHLAPLVSPRTPTSPNSYTREHNALHVTPLPVNFDLNLSHVDSPTETHAVEAGDPGAPQKITSDEGNMRTGMMCSPQCNRNNADFEGTSESSSISSSDDFVQPSGGARGRPPSLHAPVSHIHTTRKVRDWTLSVTKPIAIIGDSNLRRIPFIANSNLQIDSFPGARFDHLRGVLDKLEPNQNVKLVILAAGINDLTRPKGINTIWKEFLRTLSSCRVAFPKASVYVAQLNFSRRLAPHIQTKIEEFNARVVEKCHFLTPLAESEFVVGRKDLIHWTSETGLKILDHWMVQLNSLQGKHAFQPLL